MSEPTTPVNHEPGSWPPVQPGPIRPNPASSQGLPDKGTRRSRLLAAVLAVVLVGATFVMQQASLRMQPAPTPSAQASSKDMTTLMLRMMTRLAHATEAVSTSPAITSQFRTSFLINLDQMAADLDEAGKVRVAIAAGHLDSAKGANTRLDRIAAALGESSAEPLDEREESFRDIETLRRLYAGEELSEESRERLRTRHGWFGRLALTFGDNPDSPERLELFKGADTLLVFLSVVGLGIFLAFGLGFVLFITAIVLVAIGKVRPRFTPPAPGGSVYLEVLVVFVAAFAGLKVFLTLAGMALAPSGGTPPAWFESLSLGAQWLLLLVPLWPLLRGVSWRQFRTDTGLHAPRGLLREVGAGILGYFAGLPILLAGAVASLILKTIADFLTGRKGVPQNPILDYVTGSSPLMLIMLVTLATIWAPLVEETVFRGALYRHLRASMPILFAGVLSALVFGMMHGYDFLLLGGVISLGLTFALIREWRGSLVGPIVAHALHNGTVMLLLLTLLRLA